MPRVHIAQYTPIVRSQLQVKVRRKTRFSNFFVTISTNYRVESGDAANYREKAERLRTTLMELFDEETPTTVLKLNGDREDSGDILRIGDSIVKYENSIGIEVGTGARGHRVHAHVLMQVEHTTNIKVKIDDIKKFVWQENEDWIPEHKRDPSEPWKAVYVQVKMVDESSKRILNYIWKGAPVTERELVDVARSVYGVTDSFNKLQIK